MDVKIEESWKKVLKDEFKQTYFQNIVQHIKTEKSQGKIIYPPGSKIFNAFNTTPFDKVKVLILGQDPYHGAGQAHGLCFSVPFGGTSGGPRTERASMGCEGPSATPAGGERAVASRSSRPLRK